MDPKSRERIQNMIRAKEEYELNLEERLRTSNPKDELRQEFVASCIPFLDYESHFASAFLGRINPQMKRFLCPNGNDVDKKRLKKVRTSEPLIDKLFQQMDQDFFQDFNSAEQRLIHGDAAEDNFGTIRGKVYLGDREIHYLKGNPQYSLWYLLATAIPDPLEREAEVSDLLCLAGQEKNDFLKIAFEQRYGALTDENRVDFVNYRKIYQKMDAFESIVQIARSLCGVKGRDMEHARKVYDSIKYRTYDHSLLDAVLQQYLDLGDEERTMEAKAILFPEATMKETLLLKHCYQTLQRERIKEYAQTNLKQIAKTVVATSLISAFTVGGYMYAGEGEFHYEKGHEATKKEPYSYAADAPFTINTLYFDSQLLDGKIMSYTSKNFFLEAIPYINPGSDSTLSVYYNGTLRDQCIEVSYGESLIFREDVNLVQARPYGDQNNNIFHFTWPCDVSPAINLNVTVTSCKDPSLKPDFSASYYAFSDPVGMPLHKGYKGVPCDKK